jgi:ATP-binding cassette, subfamily B, bacterial
MATNRNTIKIYLGQIKHHLPSFLIALICMPATTLLIDTGLAYFLSMAIGDLSSGNTQAMQQHLLLAAVVGAGGVLANFIGFQALVRHESKIRTRLYNFVFSALLHKDLQFFVNEKVGALTSRFIDFTRSHILIQDLLIIRTLGFSLSLIVGLTIVAQSAPLLALILLGLIIVIVVQIKIFTSIRAPFRHKRKKLIGEIHGEIADSITNSLMVKTFAQEEHEKQHLYKRTKELERIFIKDISLFGVDGTIRTSIMIATQVVAISIAATMVANGQLTIAIAIFSMAYLQRLASQTFQLGELINGYDEALLQAAPMSDILSKPVTVLDTPNSTDHVITTPVLSFNDVSYHYGDSKVDVIDSLNLTIPAGQRVGLVGHSGAGKTTITHLLLRFADVTKGSITLDGVDLRDYTQHSLRQQIAYVPQEPLLFHRSLRENITYGKLDATDEEVRRAAKQANALEFIETLPKGFDTLVGERGVKLSGGQRQRVAIARAILKDAPILVLDEATSALDSESEVLIQKALKKLMEGRTSIVIAHRLSTIAKLDRIIVMEDGAIIEDGSHEELLAKSGKYAQLWAHQSGGFIEE